MSGMSRARLAACVLLLVAVFHAGLAANLYPAEAPYHRRGWLSAGLWPTWQYDPHTGYGWPLPAVRVARSGMEDGISFNGFAAIIDGMLWLQIVGLSALPLIVWIRNRRRERLDWRELSDTPRSWSRPAP